MAAKRLGEQYPSELRREARVKRRRYGISRAAGLVAVLAGLLFAAMAAAAEEPLPILARVGPWPVVSELIGFRGRLWLVNSVKSVNHNSADLYSYDPKTAELSYERHLFSQDAGRPLVADGLLYWPFEDARASLGVGHFMVTDGERWRLGTIPSAQIFHTHAMVASDRGLIAATSAWRAGLQLSLDRGRSWRQVYDHPTPERRVTRIVRLAALGDLTFGYVIGNGQMRLLLDGARVTEVPGWPADQAIVGLSAFAGHLYGIVLEARGAAVWRTDGKVSERVSPPRANWAVDDLAAGADSLWALAASGNGGAVWHSPDGVAWEVRYRLKGGRPYELAVHRGAVYVGGAGDDGRGVLWGLPRPPGAAPALPRAGMPPWPATDTTERDWTAAGRDLDRLLADPASYLPAGRPLRDLVLELALADPPAGFFSERLAWPFPTEDLSLIGGNVRVPAAKMARWILLWGMSLAGRGEVPLALLEEPWTAPPNPSEKYFEAPPAAMWTAALVGQDDPATIEALIGRLERKGDPLWLRGDALGALVAVTGQRFGYDAAAWRRWWQQAKQASRE
jgi:hypothetical protein